LKAIADIVTPSVQLIRGSLCVICQDPENPVAALWNKDASQPIINEAALKAVTDAIKKSLLAVKEMAVDC